MRSPSVDAIQRAWGRRSWGALVAVEEAGDEIRLVIDQRVGGLRLEVRLPGPGDPEAPWLYAEPRDLDDWAGMLLIWLDEIFLTGRYRVDQRRVLVPAHDGESLAPGDSP